MQMLNTDSERPVTDGLVARALVTQMNMDNDPCRVLQVTTFPQQSQVKAQRAPGTKLGNEYVKAVYCHSAYLTYMQSISCEMLGWMKHKLESRLPGEISITSDTQMTPPLWQKVKKN